MAKGPCCQEAEHTSLIPSSNINPPYPLILDVPNMLSYTTMGAFNIKGAGEFNVSGKGLEVERGHHGHIMLGLACQLALRTKSQVRKMFLV